MIPPIRQLVMVATVFASVAASLPAQCYALNFDGRGDRVVVPYSSSFPYLVFTASAWINTPGTTRRSSIISFGEDNASGNQSWTLYIQTNGEFQLMIEDLKDVNASYTSGVKVTDSKWHHVAVSRQSSGRVDLYVDGKLTKTHSSSIAPSTNNKQNITIGITMGILGPPPPPPKPVWFFRGMIDEPALWNVALTAAQVGSVYASGVDPKSTGLIGYWSFDEGTGQAVKDASPAKNDGYLGASTSVDTQDPTFSKRSGPGSYTAFGAGCRGTGGTPKLAATTGQVPNLGESFEVTMTNLPSAGTAMGVLGFSKTAWGPIPLPLNLTIIGMTNCVLHVDAFVLIPIPYTGGTAKWQVSIPDSPILLGQKFYQQGFIPDAGANAYGSTLTNAGEGVVGCK